ncbi:MAG: hypothetical protein NE328_00570 [Lentisphaeraceae bacterium]|nr:hypothetical protein [Lentisphaeraceae bacterium]
MTTTKIQKSNLITTSLALSVLLTLVSFYFFDGFSRSEPWILMGLFFFDSIAMSFALYKARQTGDVFLWGIGAKGLKTMILFMVVGFVCYLNLVQEVMQFATFFCLGFVALMVFEIKHILKEFGKEIEC